MKHLLLVAIMGLGLVSCKKDQDMVPQQTVTYTAECERCVVEIEDADYNYTNELETAKRKTFVVAGKFKYSFVNTIGLKSVKMRVYTSVFMKDQIIKASVSTGKKNIVEINEKFGRIDWQNYLNDKTIELTLN